MRFLRQHIIASLLTLCLLTAGGLSGFVGNANAGRDHEPLPQTEASAWHSGDHSRVRLFRAGVNEDGQDMVGLIIDLEEGWHTYWRSPGRLGLPPTFNWEGSENLRGVTVRWPLPEYISFDDYETYGYEGRLVLPLEISRENPDEPASLQLALGYAVCESVCIPVLGFLAMNLPEGERAARARPEFTWTFEDAMSRVPTWDIEAAGIEISAARLVRTAGTQRALRISLSSQTPFDDPHVILEGPKDLRFGTPKLMLDSTGRHLEALISVRRREGEEAAIGHGFKITVTGGAMPVQHSLSVTMAGGVQGSEEMIPEQPLLPVVEPSETPD